MSTAELQYHIKLKKGDVGRYVLLPGDPGRVPVIASYLTDARKIAENREHQTYTGTLEGVPVSVTSMFLNLPADTVVEPAPAPAPDVPLVPEVGPPPIIGGASQ